MGSAVQIGSRAVKVRKTYSKGHLSIKLEHLVRLIGWYMQRDTHFFGRCSQSFVSGPQGYFLLKENGR